MWFGEKLPLHNTQRKPVIMVMQGDLLLAVLAVCGGGVLCFQNAWIFVCLRVN